MFSLPCGGSPTSPPAESASESLAAAEHEHCICRIRQTELSRALRGSLRGDKQAYIEACADKAQSVSLGETFSPLACLSKARKKGPRNLPRLKSIHDACATPGEVAEQWRLHCARMEGGNPTTAAELQRQADAFACLLSRCTEMPTFDALPSWTALETKFRTIKPFKCPGPDGKTSLLCHTLPNEMARLFFQSCLKRACFTGSLLRARVDNCFMPIKARVPVMISHLKEH